MNIVIECVDAFKALEICEKDKHTYLHPSITHEGMTNELVDVVINDVCSIKQVLAYNGLQIITKFGHIILLEYKDYGCIRIL